MAALPSWAAAQDRTPAVRPDPPTYWVDGAGGDDANDGRSEASAFATIQRAANAVQSGEVVGIKRGLYRETVVVPTDGTKGAPVVFRAQGPGKAVITGGDRVTGWTPHSGDVWGAPVDWDANGSRAGNTLFVNGDLSMEARQFAENDLLDINDWGQLPQTGLKARFLRAPELVGFGNDLWNGAQVTFHVNDWTITTRTVTDYHSDAGRVRFDPPVEGILLKQTTGFYLWDTIEALDRPGEWFKDKDADVLYYHAEPGQDPNGLRIEFKRRGYGFDLRGRRHVQVQGLVFRGTTLRLDGGNEGNLYQGNVFYGFGKGNGSGFDRMSVSGTGNVFRDNEVYQSFHTALDVYGTGNVVANNYFHDIALQTGRMVINAASSAETLISHNTFRKIGRSVLDGYPVRSEIAHNLIEDAGRISWDTGAFDSDGLNGNSSYSIFHHNVFRGTQARGIMEGFYGGNDNAVIHHNLFHDWTSGGNRPTLRILGLNFQQAYHNTIIGAIGPQGNTDARDAIRTRYNGNLQIDTAGVAAVGVDMRGNHDYSPSDFVSFEARDFRLAPGSGAIDAGIVIEGVNDGFTGSAPDAGALELGEAMWPVGHDFTAPHRPTYSWTPYPGTNVFTNGDFSQGIDDWTIVSGSPFALDHNSWNMGPNSLTGTFRTKSVELAPGAEMTATFTGLRPGAIYTLGCTARIISEVASGDLYADASDPVQTGEVRGVQYVTGLLDGGWVRYDDVDFGAPGQFDTIELLPNVGAAGLAADGIRVQIRLDDPGGQVLLDVGDLTQQIDAVGRTWKRHVRSTFGSITGPHSLFVVVSGANAGHLAIGPMRLLDSNPDPSDLLTASLTAGSSHEVRGIGASDWIETFETLSLQAGDATTSVDVAFANQGRTNAYLDRMFLTEGPVDLDNANVAETDGLGAQSSTSGTLAASAALDGDSSTSTSTVDAPNSWWQVGFYQPINPGQIDLVNPAAAATGELGNFKVTVFGSDPAAGGAPLWERSYFPTGGVLPGETFTIPGDEIGADGSTRLMSTLGAVIRVQLNGMNGAGTGVLRLAEVRILTGEDVAAPANVARAGVAEQSSDNSTQSGRGPHRALDGYINPLSGFTSTLADGQDWWQVNLGQTPTIDQIRLFNRGGEVGDRLRNFRVSVWSGDPRAGGVERWGREYAGTAPRGGSVTFNGSSIGSAGNRLDSVGDGSVVRVQLNQTNFLSLTEVQVWTR